MMCVFHMVERKFSEDLGDLCVCEIFRDSVRGMLDSPKDSDWIWHLPAKAAQDFVCFCGFGR